jgi:hypothetical protein
VFGDNEAKMHKSGKNFAPLRDFKAFALVNTMPATATALRFDAFGVTLLQTHLWIEFIDLCGEVKRPKISYF